MTAPLTAPAPLRPLQVPPCTRLGAQCRGLNVILRVGSLEEGRESLDHESTWLLGHTQHISFGDLWNGDGDLYVDATLHVPCRYLKTDGAGARCAAFGFQGPLPRGRPKPPQPRRLGRDQFRIVDSQRQAVRVLPPPAPPAPAPARRALPVLQQANPCATAPCETADHRRGAACCRDLQVEIMCERKNVKLEALVRSRKSPYLCKVDRAGDFSIEAEMISACDYLGEDGVACTLHGRQRADGRPAKPDLCSEWPPKNQGLHPGCVFGRRRRRAG